MFERPTLLWCYGTSKAFYNGLLWKCSNIDCPLHCKVYRVQFAELNSAYKNVQSGWKSSKTMILAWCDSRRKYPIGNSLNFWLLFKSQSIDFKLVERELVCFDESHCLPHNWFDDLKSDTSQLLYSIQCIDLHPLLWLNHALIAVWASLNLFS